MLPHLSDAVAASQRRRRSFPIGDKHDSSPLIGAAVDSHEPKYDPWPSALATAAVSLATTVALVQHAPSSITGTLAMALLTIIARVRSTNQ